MTDTEYNSNIGMDKKRYAKKHDCTDKTCIKHLQYALQVLLLL